MEKSKTKDMKIDLKERKLSFFFCCLFFLLLSFILSNYSFFILRIFNFYFLGWEGSDTIKKNWVGYNLKIQLNKKKSTGQSGSVKKLCVISVFLSLKMKSCQ